MSWLGKISRFLGLSGGRRHRDLVKRGPLDDIDPIEELARIINEAQDRDDLDERRFDALARVSVLSPSGAPGARGDPEVSGPSMGPARLFRSSIGNRIGPASRATDKSAAKTPGQSECGTKCGTRKALTCQYPDHASKISI